MKSTAGTMWRYRWFFLACAGVAAHALVWHLALQRRGGSVSPMSAPERSAIVFNAGMDGTVSGRGALQWEFETPPPSGIPACEWTLNGPILIRPEVPGRLIWSSPTTLLFTPSDDWPSCTEFEAELPAAWTTGEIAPRFTFRTAPLEVNSIRLAEVLPDRRTIIQVHFSAMAGDGDITPYISLLDANKQPVPFSVSRRDAGRGLVLTSMPVPSNKLIVNIRQGFPAAEGPRGLSQTVQETIVLRQDFTLIGHECKPPAFGPMSIVLRMSQSMDTRANLDAITISPETDFTARVNVSYGYWDPSSQIILTGAFEAGGLYRVSLPAGLTSAAGDRLTGTREISVAIPDREAGIRIMGAGNILSRDGARQVRLETVNTDTLSIRLEKLYPNNLPWFIHRRGDMSSRYWWRGESASFAGLSRQLADKTIPVLHRRNRIQETAFNIPELAGDNDASGIYLLTASQQNLYVEQMINLTRLAITVRHTSAEGIAWITRLGDASSAPGARVSVLSAENQLIAEGTTDGEGCYRWKSPEAAQPAMLIATLDGDTTYLNLRDARLTLPDPVDGAPYPATDVEAWLLSERNLYRPDDTVQLAVLVRDRHLGAAPASMPVKLEVTGPDGKTFTTIPATLDAAGSAAFTFELPAGLRTGTYRAALHHAEPAATLGIFTFSVQAFMPPRMEVTLDIENSGKILSAPHPITVSVNASYYHGGAAANLPVESFVSFNPADFRPVGFDDYTFSDSALPFSPQFVSLGSAVLGNDGSLRLTVPTEMKRKPPSMIRATLASTVQDHDGRTASALVSLPLHVYHRYAGLKIETGRVSAGVPVALFAALISVDGAHMTGDASLNVMVERLEWSSSYEPDSNGAYRYCSKQEAVPLRSFPLPVHDGVGREEWTPPEDGQYRITLEDPLSGARSSRTLQVAGPDGYDGPADLENPYRLTLALDDGAVYQPGDHARIHVTSPFPGNALISVEGPDLFWSTVQDIKTTAAVLTIPLPAEVRGHGVYCSVTMVRPLQRGARPLPVRATGIIRIPVARPATALAVTLQPPAAPLAAGQSGRIAVSVSHANGEPAAGAVVWLTAVDEAISALGNWAAPDPLRDLLRNRRLDTVQADPFQMLLPEWGDLPILRHDAAPGGDAPIIGANRLNPFRGRRYTPTAWWIGRFTADAQGRIVADTRWPAFDGRIRITAVAATAQALGASTESRICRHPVILRSGLPRVFASGDRATVGIDIINRTDDKTLDLNLRLRTEGPIQAEWTDTGVRIAPGARHELAVPVTAGPSGGSAAWHLTASGPDGDITEEVVIPVEEIRIRRVLRQTVVIAPGESTAWPSFPSLASSPTITLAGTPVPHLQPLLRGLQEYPYGCLEQTIARVFPLLALQGAEALASAGTGLTREGAGLRIRQAVQRVLTMQRTDGAFGYWPGDDSRPFAWGSIFATHFLAEAVRQGHTVPASALVSACRYLETSVLSGGGRLSDSSDDACRRALAAYACRALAVSGRPARNWMRTLHERAGRLDAESIAHLAVAFAEDTDRRSALELLRRTESLPVIPPADGTDAYLASELRTLAVITDAWNRQDPALPESVSASIRLAQAIKQRSWLNTQEQTWGLTALLPAAAAPAAGPVSARLEQEGRSDILPLDTNGIATVTLDPKAATPAVLYNTGSAPLYVQSTHILLEQAADMRTVLPISNGLRIRREWLDRDGHPLATASIRRGELIVAAITIECANRSAVDHLVIEDRFPSGLEAENSVQTLAVTLPWLRGRSTLPLRHTDIRDDRALFFTDRFSGVQTIHYALRAVTPGQYRAAPVSAEQMYNAAINAQGVPGSFEVLP